MPSCTNEPQFSPISQVTGTHSVFACGDCAERCCRSTWVQVLAWTCLVGAESGVAVLHVKWLFNFAAKLLSQREAPFGVPPSMI